MGLVVASAAALWVVVAPDGDTVTTWTPESVSALIWAGSPAASVHTVDTAEAGSSGTGPCPPSFSDSVTTTTCSARFGQGPYGGGAQVVACGEAEPGGEAVGADEEPVDQELLRAQFDHGADHDA